MFGESTALTAYRTGFRGRPMMAALLMAQTISIGNAMSDLHQPKPTWRTEDAPARRGANYRRMEGVGKKRALRKVKKKMRQVSRRK